MDEELQKRFTDCVYFLASPLTCKKGIECDFRHNEIARLNPRDCWYWLGGCCFNPDCAFRHPPLEGLKDAYHESLNPDCGPTLPVDKTNVPCYFFSKGFCNKAERCSFLHEPMDCNKAMVKDVVPCEKQLSAGNNTSSTSVQILYTHPNPPEPAKTKNTHTVMKSTPDSHQLVSRSESVESEENVEREEFVESEEYVEREDFVESEENVDREEFVESEENVEREEFVESEEIVVQSESDVYNDQSSDGYEERERWLGLSPGFDVLVERESERLEYEENDVDLFMVDDEERRKLAYHYPEYDRYDKFAGQSRVSIFDRLSFKKRSVHKKVLFNVQRGYDLRDQIKKSKLIDFDRCIGKNFRPHGSCGEVDFDFEHRGRLRKAVPVNRYRPPLKKPRFFSSDVSRLRNRAQQHKRESREQSNVFTGPKTLVQIKEEKKKTWENRDLGSNNQTGSDGFFQGPRPLSEILKNKRKLG